MKIVCTKDEAFTLIRVCGYCKSELGCRGCALEILANGECEGIEVACDIEIEE